MKTFCILLLTLFTSSESFSQSLKSENGADTTNIIRCIFEDDPKFPGGQEALVKFLSKNLRHPKNGADISGRVILSFIVQTNGRLTDFRIMRGLSPEYDKEAIRVMKKSPKWIPAKQNGKPTAARYTIPISCILPTTE